MKLKINLALCAAIFLALAVILTQTPQTAASSATSTANCKDLNHVNCYQGQNEGNFCSKKDTSTAVTRFYFDKGNCKKFIYKGCNGNRNRFCTREACERRCGNR